MRMPRAIWTHSEGLYEVSIDRTARILNLCEGKIGRNFASESKSSATLTV